MTTGERSSQTHPFHDIAMLSWSRRTVVSAEIASANNDDFFQLQ